MPELPEVETVRSQLAAEIVKKKIKDINISMSKLIKSPLAQFKRVVINSKIKAVKRRAKILIIGLVNGYSILVHLKMTGQLIYKAKNKITGGGHPIKDGTKNLPNKYSHIFFIFSDGTKLFYNDLRQFGYMRLVKTSELPELFEQSKLGPEPMESNFTYEVFERLLKNKKNSKIKPLLMDQTFVSGIGNIYAIESCFAAGIKPTRRVGTLSKLEKKKLYQNLMRILKLAITKQGTSAKNFVDAYGEPGNYVPLLKIYGRVGEPCVKCKTMIKAIHLGGRGTTYCPKCQK